MAAAAWEAAWKVQCPIPRDCPSCEKKDQISTEGSPWQMPKNAGLLPPENEQMSPGQGPFQKETSLPIQSEFF